jgi:putative addiction module component (TIGR02574 family)
VTTEAQRIEQAIRALPLEDMLALHQQLVESIHEKEESVKLDPAYRSEIERRVKEIETGTARRGGISSVAGDVREFRDETSQAARGRTC